MFIDRLKKILDRPGLDAHAIMLIFDVQDLAMMLYRAARLAAFQQQQLGRMAKLVREEHAAEAAMIVTRGDEVGEAVAGEFETWLGPGAVEWLEDLEAKQAERASGG